MKPFIIVLCFLLSLNTFAEDEKSSLRPGADVNLDFAFLPEVVASYKGQDLKAEKLLKLMKSHLVALKGQLLNQQELKQMTVHFIEDYYRRLISLEMAKDDGFEPNLGLALLRMQQMEKEKGRNKIEEEFKITGLTYDEIVQFLAETKALDEWFERKIIKECSVEEAEALVFYSDNKEKFFQPARIQIAEIYTGYVDAEQREKARNKCLEAAGKLQLGQKFENVARLYSEGQQAKGGGVMLHFFAKEELKEELQVVFDMPVGEVSDLIESPGGFHIIKVLDRTEPGIPQFKEIKEQLMVTLVREKAFALIEKRLKKRKQNANYRIYIE